MRGKQQLGMIVMVITVVGVLVVGAGSVFAQEGNGTTAADNSSEFNCEETTEIVVAVGQDGNITETVPVGWLNYSDRVDRVLEEIQQEYGDDPGVVTTYLTRNPNKQVCGLNVSQVGVGINSSEFDGNTPDQRNGVSIVTEERTAGGDALAIESGTAGEGGAAGGGGAGSGGGATSTETMTTETTEETTVQEETTEETDDSGEGKAKSGDTTTEAEDSGGKAKQPSDGDGDDGAADGGNGKAKMGDGSDGNDTVDGGNGKAKEN